MAQILNSLNILRLALLILSAVAIIPKSDIRDIRAARVRGHEWVAASGGALDILQGHLLLQKRSLEALRVFGCTFQISEKISGEPCKAFAAAKPSNQAESLDFEEEKRNEDAGSLERTQPATGNSSSELSADFYKTVCFLFPDVAPFGCGSPPLIAVSSDENEKPVGEASSLSEYLERQFLMKSRLTKPGEAAEEASAGSKEMPEELESLSIKEKNARVTAKLDILARLIAVPEKISVAEGIPEYLLRVFATPTAYPMNMRAGAYLLTRESLISTFLILYLENLSQYVYLITRVFHFVKDTPEMTRLFALNNGIDGDCALLYSVYLSWRPKYPVANTLDLEIPETIKDEESAVVKENTAIVNRLHLNLLKLVNVMIYNPDSDLYDTSKLKNTATVRYYKKYGDTRVLWLEAWEDWQRLLSELCPLALDEEYNWDVETQARYFLLMFKAVVWNPESLAESAGQSGETDMVGGRDKTDEIGEGYKTDKVGRGVERSIAEISLKSGRDIGRSLRKKGVLPHDKETSLFPLLEVPTKALWPYSLLQMVEEPLSFREYSQMEEPPLTSNYSEKVLSIMIYKYKGSYPHDFNYVNIDFYSNNVYFPPLIYSIPLVNLLISSRNDLADSAATALHWLLTHTVSVLSNHISSTNRACTTPLEHTSNGILQRIFSNNYFQPTSVSAYNFAGLSFNEVLASYTY